MRSSKVRIWNCSCCWSEVFPIEHALRSRSALPAHVRRALTHQGICRSNGSAVFRKIWWMSPFLHSNLFSETLSKLSQVCSYRQLTPRIASPSESGWESFSSRSCSGLAGADRNFRRSRWECCWVDKIVRKQAFGLVSGRILVSVTGSNVTGGNGCISEYNWGNSVGNSIREVSLSTGKR